MKRLLHRLLACIIASIFATSSHAYDVEIDGIFYGLNTADMTASVTYKGPYPYSYNYTGAVSIPSSITCKGIEYFVTTIGEQAFYGCTGLTSVTIPEGVTTIGDKAFYGCTGLTSVTIPEGVTDIELWAFRNCSSLTELTIPNSVKSFYCDSGTFYGCTALKKIYLPDGTRISANAFNVQENVSLPQLEEISVEKLPMPLGCYFGTSSLNEYLYVSFWQHYDNDSRWCQIPSTLKKITIRNQSEFTDYALEATKGFVIELGDTPINKVGKNAFYNSGATQIILSDSVTSLDHIGSSPNLKLFSGKGLQELKSLMFSGSPLLQKLELPFPGPGTASSVGNFGDLFGNSSGDGLRAVTQFFENGTNKTYYIPSSLTELVLTEGCEMIPYGGLYNCNMLEKVTLPTSLYMVGEKAFFGCAKISDIYCKGADPAVAYDSSFEGMRVSSCKLHIPYNTAELYKRSTGWKNFYYFEEEAPLSISVTKTIENAGVVYGLNEYQPGQTAELKAVANSGYTFMGWMENGLLLTGDAVYSFVVADSRELTAWFVPVLDDNTVEVSPSPDGATFSYVPVDGAASYRLDVYTDEEMTIPAGSTVETAQEAKAQARAAASTRTVSISGLNAGSQYYYKITALTESGIILSQFTGSFTTESATGIDDVTAGERATVTARYDSTGRRTDAPVKGLNIIRYSDGSVRKVIVR